MTGICWIQVYRSTAVQTGGSNGSFNFWFHVQEPLLVVNQRDVIGIYNALNGDNSENLKTNLLQKFDTTLSHDLGPFVSPSQILNVSSIYISSSISKITRY